MDQAMEYLGMLAQALGALVVLATVLVRLTPSKKDDEEVGKYLDMINKFIAYLPTIGLNPQTKKLREAYDEVLVKK